ncbi:hypothetical protein CEE36_03315 [candidate division TA06 bacterium B3_TA06]|uniref:DUF3108 domain-containing protein n=1 Tax=candidate division TA06 bacterium B3_TA06 TaxID=2012487 RepID=A0A532V957_UNCT6|nr:MAG: hypothetical protein CEE36_03315 [candidate division TA06 bacterium B3_TA06]
MNALIALLLIAAGFSDPGIPNGEKVVYLGYDQGTTREISHEVYDNGDNYYSVHEHHDTTRIIVKCWVQTSDLSTIKVIKDRSGRFQLGVQPIPEGILVSDGFKGKSSKVRHEGSFYDRHTLIEAFRGFPFERPQTVEFGFFESNVGMVITGTCTYGGIHTIQTDAGEFRCHKLTLGFKSKFVETVYRMLLAGRSFDFYYEVREPHRMIYWTDNKDGYMKLIRIENEGE